MSKQRSQLRQWSGLAVEKTKATFLSRQNPPWIWASGMTHFAHVRRLHLFLATRGTTLFNSWTKQIFSLPQEDVPIVFGKISLHLLLKRSTTFPAALTTFVAHLICAHMNPSCSTWELAVHLMARLWQPLVERSVYWVSRNCILPHRTMPHTCSPEGSFHPQWTCDGKSGFSPLHRKPKGVSSVKAAYNAQTTWPTNGKWMLLHKLPRNHVESNVTQKSRLVSWQPRGLKI